MKLWPVKKAKDDVLRCSFCNLSQRDVKLLISGPNIYICDQCVDICNTIIAEHRANRRRSGGARIVMPPPNMAYLDSSLL